jgi:hypothetical protein
MKRYGNDIIIFSLLQISYRSLGVPNPYARLISGTMWEWFTKDGVLKKKSIQATNYGTTKENPK